MSGASGLRLRPVGEGDRELLRAIYASTRAEELAVLPWNDAAKAEFLAFQFEAQDRAYREYTDASFSVVEVDGAPAGRLYVARWAEEIRVIDVALLPPFRGRGIGTRLLSDLAAQADASGRTLTIHVEVNNPARRLYERLGFVEAGAAGALHLLLARPPAGTAAASS